MRFIHIFMLLSLVFSLANAEQEFGVPRDLRRSSTRTRGRQRNSRKKEKRQDEDSQIKEMCSRVSLVIDQVISEAFSVD